MKLKRTPSVTPTLCPHCHKYVFAPPCYLRVLAALAPTLSKRHRFGFNSAPLATQNQIAIILGLTRERVRQMLVIAKNAKVLDYPFPGSSIYALSEWGRILLKHWLLAGWHPSQKYDFRSQALLRADLWAASKVKRTEKHRGPGRPKGSKDRFPRKRKAVKA